MDELALLKQIPLFSDMDENEVAGVRAIMQSQNFVAGQVIIYEGEEGDLFHIITEGEVQFLTFDAEGNELVLDDVGPGGYFGELSMLTAEPRAIRVRALDNVKTLTLNRTEFHDFLMKHPHAAIDVLTVVSRRLHTTDSLLRRSISRNVNIVHDEMQTIGQRIADGFAAMMGSWRFIIIQSCILICWVTLNVIAWTNQWDPYPFILLNLMLSFQAAYAAPIIMMSQNRQSDKDRLAAEIDHEINVKAEIKTGLIISRLDDLEKGIHELHRQHMELLKNYKI